MPRPWEYKQKFDLITADFMYVRWLSDRKGIVDRRDDLMKWRMVKKLKRVEIA